MRVGGKVVIIGHSQKRPKIWDRFSGTVGTVLSGRADNHLHYEHYRVRLHDGGILTCPLDRLQEVRECF